ncbi:MAG: rhodanese-like domain-containing protein, partial [Butyrivibrio sp.]|nr:rhodanese-like domain-containing protein [Butyrivibrio sp.]
MGIFDLFGLVNINQEIEKLKDIRDAVLIDVRSKEEFSQGHILESLNIPLDEIQNIDKKVQDRNTPIFLYCHSGVRSSKAAKILRKMGY